MARPSTVDLIAAELRTAIFTGALPVGSPIGEVEMSSQLGVSRGPLREAAQRLVEEGLLTASPGRGLRVTTIGPDQIADVYDARMAIESQAARMIAAAPAAFDLEALDRALAALETVSEGDDARAIGDADLAFHRLLVDTVGSPRLSKAMATLAIETRIASLSEKNGYSVRRTVSPTYRELMTALRDGDAAMAEDALRRQFAAAVDRLTGRDDDVETIETPVEGEPQAFSPIAVVDET
ncbi:GntR family transcriptional regulator [Agromyces silvae]|uniref:GntR family transcriptional regulator n=1 Tax=Agromyces silvae TaxID=3388266 RepID=UPI00280B06C6|nr:GntR family transcriptional regulator [Agromyces protaetiae]